ncbi:M56 family metallopeptidase [Candidatus Soleaferrea massiliensis]|uniref:M56 family metallopeptidase n=1 Tax=Candidatus Soleaferrea massiliensis TaxID=1470354 RepID=UPI00058E97E5|nr:M56 family metallopeptidase [Candidatus Soleaferrea massiliensis]
MQLFAASLLLASLSTACVILLYIALRPLLSKRFAAKGRYYAWLVVLALLLIPFRPQFSFAPVRLALPETAAVRTEETLPQDHPEDTSWMIGPVASSMIGGQVPLQPQEKAHPADAPADVSPAGAAGSAPEWYDVVLAVWLLGAACYLGFSLAKHRRFMKLVKRWRRQITDEMVCGILREACGCLHIKRSLEVYRCRCVNVPMLVGFIHPMILLPHADYSGQELSLILKHELIHYRRRDLWYKLMVLLCTALHWFNPVVHLAGKYISLDCEISCDQEVLINSGADCRQYYGKTLISLATLKPVNRTVLSTSFFGGVKTMKKRLSELVSTKVKRRGITIVALLLTVGVLFGGIISFVGAADAVPSPDLISAENVEVGFDLFDVPENKELIWSTFQEEFAGLSAYDQEAITLTGAPKPYVEYWNLGFFRTMTAYDGPNEIAKFIICRKTPKTAQVCIDLLAQNKETVQGLINSFLNTPGLEDMTAEEMQQVEGFPYSISFHCFSADELGRGYAANPENLQANVVDGYGFTAEICSPLTVSEDPSVKTGMGDFGKIFKANEYAPTSYLSSWEYSQWTYEYDMENGNAITSGVYIHPINYDGTLNLERMRAALGFTEAIDYTDEWYLGECFKMFKNEEWGDGTLSNGICLSVIVNYQGKPTAMSTFFSVDQERMPDVVACGTRYGEE